MDDYELYESQWEAVDVAYRDGNFIGSTALPGPGAASDAAAADGSGVLKLTHQGQHRCLLVRERLRTLRPAVPAML